MKAALVVLTVLATLALASHPRLTVLGGDARLMLDDYTEIWAYPGTMSDYEFVTGESETGDDTTDGWFGVVKQFGGTTMGLTINHMDYMHEFMVHPGNWGFILSVDYEKETFDPDEEGDAVNIGNEMEINASWGTDIQLFGDYTDLAIGLNYGSYSSDSEGGDESSDLGLAASVRGHRDDFLNLFPIISVSYSSSSISELAGADVDLSESDIMLDLGVGHNHMVAPKTHLVMGAFAGVQSHSYGGDDNEGVDSETYIHIPALKGGVEQEIGKWLVFRAGATSTTEYSTTNVENGTLKSFETDFNTYFGTAITWDNFSLDATIGEDFLHDGPYMVGGNANGFMGSVAATYTF